MYVCDVECPCLSRHMVVCLRRRRTALSQQACNDVYLVSTVCIVVETVEGVYTYRTFIAFVR
jgi:hypothetical protein